MFALYLRVLLNVMVLTVSVPWPPIVQLACWHQLAPLVRSTITIPVSRGVPPTFSGSHVLTTSVHLPFVFGYTVKPWLPPGPSKNFGKEMNPFHPCAVVKQAS